MSPDGSTEGPLQKESSPRVSVITKPDSTQHSTRLLGRKRGPESGLNEIQNVEYVNQSAATEQKTGLSQMTCERYISDF